MKSFMMMTGWPFTLIRMNHEEQKLQKIGFRHIAGVDEAGRGPLAGPVVAAAVIFPDGYRNGAINDSKQLSALQREELFVEIKNNALSFGVSALSAGQVDKLGIANAGKLAMRQAVLKLDPLPDFILVDAFAINVTDIPQKAIIKGDSKVLSIAAASILAKVTRDRLMLKYHERYPQYGFNEHMGYGTEVHLSALKKHGLCPIHRRSFKVS